MDTYEHTHLEPNPQLEIVTPEPKPEMNMPPGGWLPIDYPELMEED